VETDNGKIVRGFKRLPSFDCALNLPKPDDLLANILALALFWGKGTSLAHTDYVHVIAVQPDFPRRS
jgi:hypothetical protein